MTTLRLLHEQLVCGKRTKGGKSCRRFITGTRRDEEDWYFHHKKIGDCDLRNFEWRCYQHTEVTLRGREEEDAWNKLVRSMT